MILRARDVTFSFPRPAIIMGILNATPDSFSDGGQFLEASAAIDRAHELAAQGAEIIDLGGESTRPNALPVDEAEELRRVMPVLSGLAGKIKALISIDTYKPEVARRAIEAGATMLNNVGAKEEDPEIMELAAQTGVAYVAMHMQGTPRDMQMNPVYANVVTEVGSFFRDQITRLAKAGLREEQLILDVGIGFGKTRRHNLELIAHLPEFKQFERPLLLGVSRKSFLSARERSGTLSRLPAALACSCWAVQNGVQILRTHDVSETLHAVRMIEEIAAAAEALRAEG